MEEKPADTGFGQEEVKGPKNVECDEEIVRRDSAATSDNTDSSDNAARSEEKSKSITSEQTSGIETGSGSTTSAAETDAVERISVQSPMASERSSAQTRSASELLSLCVDESDHLAIEIKPVSTNKSISAPSASLVSSVKTETSDVGEKKSESSSTSESEPEYREPKYRRMSSETSTSSIGKAPAPVKTTVAPEMLSTFKSFIRTSEGAIEKLLEIPKIKQSSTSESECILSDQDIPEGEKLPGNVKKPRKKPITVPTDRLLSDLFDNSDEFFDSTASHTLESSSEDTSCTDIPSTLSGAESLPPDSAENTSEGAEGSLSSSEQMDIHENEPSNEDSRLEK